MRKLEGKVALVTGAGRGIGRALALKLSSEGARIVVNDLDAAPAEEVVAAVRAAGSDAITCPGSVTEADFPARFIRAALHHFGEIDIIVNNAGYTWDNVIQKMTDEQFTTMLEVHVTAPFRILREASVFIRERARKEKEGGREVFRKVVNISSVAGLSGNAGQVNYSAAKAAVVGMTKALCKEWGRYCVNVNCVSYGLIRTRLTQPIEGNNSRIAIAGKDIAVGMQPVLLDALERQTIPLGRAGTAEEAADGAYLFCIPESNYISGQVLTVGGGLSF